MPNLARFPVITPQREAGFTADARVGGSDVRQVAATFGKQKENLALANPVHDGSMLELQPPPFQGWEAGRLVETEFVDRAVEFVAGLPEEGRRLSSILRPGRCLISSSYFFCCPGVSSSRISPRTRCISRPMGWAMGFQRALVL